jgi:AcrR family transcriptional regulator
MRRFKGLRERGAVRATAQAAGVAEGSLFRYFANKDSLLNEVYREIKREMNTAPSAHFSVTATLREHAQHLWNAHIQLGVAHPLKNHAIRPAHHVRSHHRCQQKAGHERLAAMSGTVREVVERGKLSELPERSVTCNSQKTRAAAGAGGSAR